MAMLFITHDLGIVRKIADRVCVMTKGQIVEARARSREVFDATRSTPTRARLLAAEPKGAADAGADATRRSLVEAGPLKVWFPIQRGLPAADRRPREGGRRRLASRCARARRSASSANPARARRRSASRCCGSSAREGPIVVSRPATSTGSARKAMRPLRRDMQVVFQDPYGSLSPRMSVAEIVAEGLAVQRPGPVARRAARGRRRARSPMSGSIRPPWTATRTNSPAASASASPSPAPWRWSRASSCSTSRPRRSTCPCRRRSSTCCATCRRGASSPTCSSATT